MNRQAGEQYKEVALHKICDADSKVQTTERGKEWTGKVFLFIFCAEEFYYAEGDSCDFLRDHFRKESQQPTTTCRLHTPKNLHNSTVGRNY